MAFVIDATIVQMHKIRLEMVESTEQHSFVTSWFLWSFWCVTCAVLAGASSYVLSPEANGSGIPQVFFIS
jgi:hypothetical protein